MSCGNAIPSRSPSARTASTAILRARLSWSPSDRGRVDVDPADAEADARRAQAVGEREERGLAAPRDDDPVHLDAVDELLQDRDAGRRLLDRFGEVAFEVLAALDPEDRALAAGVGRLEDSGNGDVGERGVDVGGRANAAKGGCGTPAAAKASRIMAACASSGGRSRPRCPGARALRRQRRRPERRGRRRRSSRRRRRAGGRPPSPRRRR